MKIKQVGKRNFIFTYYVSQDWDLNLHLIIGEKYNYIIDPGISSQTLNPMINFARVRNQNPFMVINTHYHWDHIWANCFVKDTSIIAHKNCPSLIAKDWDVSIEKNKGYIKEELEMKLPTLTFEQELEFVEDQISIFYTPGHTNDSISVYDRVEQVLNVGDNLGDTPELLISELECEVDAYLKSLKTYQNLSPKIVVSGHNHLMEKDVFDKIIKQLSVL
ncbi:MBL fold metallo-hydrolase [Fusibacter bizertensis]